VAAEEGEQGPDGAPHASGVSIALVFVRLYQ
jgi:hypothetical protein